MHYQTVDTACVPWTTTSVNRSGMLPNRFIETLVASPASDQPNTSADRFATLPRIDSLTDSSFIPSRSYESILSSVEAASAASFERTKAERASKLFSVLTEISETEIDFASRLNFVSPSLSARFCKVAFFAPSLPEMAPQSLPAKYRPRAVFHWSSVNFICRKRTDGLTARQAR
jgi:hypothetical protein